MDFHQPAIIYINRNANKFVFGVWGFQHAIAWFRRHFELVINLLKFECVKCFAIRFTLYVYDDRKSPPLNEVNKLWISFFFYTMHMYVVWLISRPHIWLYFGSTHFYLLYSDAIALIFNSLNLTFVRYINECDSSNLNDCLSHNFVSYCY